MILDLFSTICRAFLSAAPTLHAPRRSTWCPCWLGADWCLNPMLWPIWGCRTLKGASGVSFFFSPSEPRGFCFLLSTTTKTNHPKKAAPATSTRHLPPPQELAPTAIHATEHRTPSPRRIPLPTTAPGTGTPSTLAPTDQPPQLHHRRAAAVCGAVTAFLCMLFFRGLGGVENWELTFVPPTPAPASTPLHPLALTSCVICVICDL